jgi:histidinol-phosphate/aromatic aminotransferase/cobyric acid decarboxylase-like protein
VRGWKGWEHYKDGKKDREVWIPEWPIEAVLAKEDPNAVNENAELALVDACEDKKEVREFLKENAEAWRKVNAEAREKAHVVPNRRHIKHSS